MCAIDNAISDYIASAGIKKKGAGYRYLKRIIAVAIKEPDLGCLELYQKVRDGESSGVEDVVFRERGYSTVYQSMRYAIQAGAKRNGIDTKYDDDTTVYAFICKAVDSITREEQAV